MSGSLALLFALLALLHHPHWLWGVIAIASNLVLTSLTDKCQVHDLLVRLGAREREDLFLPGGRLRVAIEEPRLPRLPGEKS